MSDWRDDALCRETAASRDVDRGIQCRTLDVRGDSGEVG